MSQYVSTEAEEMEQVASNLGWSEFCEWATATETEDYPTLQHLATFGFANDAGDLLDELDAAVEASPPSEDVADIAEELADFLETHPDAEIIVVGNGMTGGDDDNEDEDGEGEQGPAEAGA